MINSEKFEIWVPLYVVKVSFWSPFCSKLDPLWVRFLEFSGPLEIGEQCSPAPTKVLWAVRLSGASWIVDVTPSKFKGKHKWYRFKCPLSNSRVENNFCSLSTSTQLLSLSTRFHTDRGHIGIIVQTTQTQNLWRHWGEDQRCRRENLVCGGPTPTPELAPVWQVCLQMPISVSCPTSWNCQTLASSASALFRGSIFLNSAFNTPSSSIDYNPGISQCCGHHLEKRIIFQRSSLQNIPSPSRYRGTITLSRQPSWLFCRQPISHPPSTHPPHWTPFPAKREAAVTHSSPSLIFRPILCQSEN